MFYILAKNMQNVLITLAKMPPNFKTNIYSTILFRIIFAKRTKQQQTKMFIKPQPMMAVYREKRTTKLQNFTKQKKQQKVNKKKCWQGNLKTTATRKAN